METVRQLDDLGRVVLPKRWRKKHRSRRVRIQEVGDALTITALPTTPLSRFVDSIVVDVPPRVFRDPHKLKKALRPTH
jgi:bifunctional DNA-binding transcriptional regulator/antitoxin component of YhaV-PrlF toxin-antitoxin module